MSEKRQAVHALLRTDPLLSGIYRKHWEVAWLLGLAKLGWLDDQELLAERKIVPLLARIRLGFRIPGGYTFYPNGDPSAWETVPASSPPGPVEFKASELLGGSVGHSEGLLRCRFFDVSGVFEPADRLAWGSKDAAGKLEPGVVEP